MKLRIGQLHLIGTSRSIVLHDGLNLIVGPISTGKSTAIRLLRGLLGGDISGMPPEVVSSVTAIAGQMQLEDETFSVVRPLASGPSVRVDIAGREEAARLPLARTSLADEESYKDWLLRRLGLPRVEVPSAPTRVESDPTPVTISDYLLYCFLSQREVSESVFGHADPFKNIKRKYVFQILYGRYNVAMAQLQEQLRHVESRVRQAGGQREAFEAMVQGTPWENRAVLAAELDETKSELASLDFEQRSFAEGARGSSPVISDMSALVRKLDSEIFELEAAQDKESHAAQRLKDLADQLRAQSARLTRTIVAHGLLGEIDFVVCPRCGGALHTTHSDDGACLLCRQQPPDPPSRETLVAEQNRIETQVEETLELIQAHGSRVDQLRKRLAAYKAERAKVGVELDAETEAFVSDSAQVMKAASATRAEMKERAKRLEDYMLLFDRLDDLVRESAGLEEESLRLRARIEAESDKEGEFAYRIDRLEHNLREALMAIGLPDFVDPREARIDRDSYLPVIGGRSFGQLSSPGLMLLVNVAHAVAHHKTALELDLPLPGLLVIDGLSSYLGREGFDYERLLAVYALLEQFATENEGRIQVLIADNDHVPGYQSFERVVLSPTNRLIPASAANAGEHE